MTGEERQLVKALVDRTKRARLISEAQAEGIPRELARRAAFPTTHPGIRYLRGCDCPRCVRRRETALGRARSLAIRG